MSDETEHESGVPRADRHRRRPHRRGIGRHRLRAEHVADEVEPDAAERERDPGEPRSLAGEKAEPDEAAGEQQRAADAGDDAGRRRQRPREQHPGRERRHQQCPLDRAVPPHLDREEHAEEQRPDERGEDECEADVRGDDVDVGGSRGSVQPTLAVRASEPRGRRRRASATATSGAWTKKIACQSKSWVSTPPSAGPTAAPTAAATAHQRRARASLPVIAAEHRERAGEQQDRPDALGAPGRQQDRQRSRPAGGQRGRGEHDDPGDDEGEWGEPSLWAMATGIETTATTRAYVMSTHETPTMVVSNSA